MLELYRNPRIDVPAYARQDPLASHLAFVCPGVRETIDRLVEAGARELEHTVTDNGDEVAMLRDPWGLPIQLCRRAQPML
jgi:hypothetical protein